MEVAEVDRRPRGVWSRVGVSALNLLAPGLGLIRIGEARAGLACIASPYVFIILFVLGQGNFPVVGLYTAILALALSVAGLVALYAIPILLTWRRSRARAPLCWWSRWYSVAAIGILLILSWQFAVPMMQHVYKGFYLPSDSMAPTAERNDKVVADMWWRGPPRRGDVILFHGPDAMRISRVAAIADDSIALQGGVPVINGVRAEQVAWAPPSATAAGGAPARISVERLPGDARTHRIADTGPSQIDDMAEMRIPAGHVFVLGDNRDQAADSRVPEDAGGAGMVPLRAIVGRAKYIYWSNDRSRIGTRLDR